MKRPFEPGDRVAVYTGTESMTDWRLTGVVEEGITPGCPGIVVRRDNDRVGTYHPKQCRRLVKRARRRVWLCRRTIEDPEGFSQVTDIRRKEPTPDFFPGTWIEFIEVRTKKEAP